MDIEMYAGRPEEETCTLLSESIGLYLFVWSEQNHIVVSEEFFA